MKKRLLAVILALVLCPVFFGGCDIDGDQKETRTEDLDEVTLRGMAKDITKELSLKEKIGQMFIVSLFSLDSSGTKNQTEITSRMKNALSTYKVGGVIFFSKNIQTPDQTKKLTKDLQRSSGIPLFISVDEECGTVARVANNKKMGTTAYPTAYEIGQNYSDKEIAQMGKKQSQQLKALGFNLNFAPVADVLTNKRNTEVGSRSFGDNAKKVGSVVSTLVKNMQSQQISATLKHFPGSGDAIGDTHRGSVKTKQSIQQFRDKEFVPFKDGIKAGADAVMVSHMVMYHVTDENEPASLSSRVVKDILRDELDYDGIILTDALNMKAITDDYSSEQASVAAAKAGITVIVMPEDLGKAYHGIENAVKNGSLKESVIDDAVNKIIYTKLKRGVIPANTKLLKENQ